MEQLAAGRIQPVVVFDDQTHRAALGQRIGPKQQGFDDHLPNFFRHLHRLRVSGVGLLIQHQRQTGHDVLPVWKALQSDVEFFAQLMRGFTIVQAEPAAQCLDQRPKGTARVFRAATQLDRLIPLLGQPALEFPHQTGLADTGIARHQQRVELALASLCPGREQAIEFGLTSHPGGLPAFPGSAVAVDMLASEGKGPYIRVETLEHRRFGQVGEVEAAFHNRPGRLAHHRATGCSERCQSRCQVNRFPQRYAGPDHHRAGDDADANLQLQLGHAFRQGECRLQRHGGGVFMGNRQPEKTHHTVIALGWVGAPAPAAQHFGAVGMKAVQGFAVAFSAQFAQQVSGVDQVVAQHCDLTHVVVRMADQSGRSQQDLRVDIPDHLAAGLVAAQDVQAFTQLAAAR